MSERKTDSYTHDRPTQEDLGPEPEDLENRRNFRIFIILMIVFVSLSVVVLFFALNSFDGFNFWSDVESPAPVTDEIKGTS